MKKYLVIGNPIEHSLSPLIHNYWIKKYHLANSIYEKRKIEEKDLKNIIKEIKDGKIIGMNVTVPFKKLIIPFLDELDDEAREIGAVNTIKVIRTADGVKLKGYNTDIYGFKETLKPLLKMNHYKALILGTGGAAKAVEYVLKKIGLDVLYVSRNPESESEKSYDELNDVAVKNFPVIVNSTPLGMYPKVDVCPDIPYEHLSEDNLLYDLIYNPGETLFMKKGAEQGANTQNGLGMLKLQAEKAWEIWNS